MKSKRKRLTENEVVLCKAPFYKEGDSYLWVLSYGWAIIGYYIYHETPLRIRVAHANFFRNAGVDYGVISQDGPSESCEWRYMGNECINEPHVVHVAEYHGEVPHGRIKLS